MSILESGATEGSALNTYLAIGIVLMSVVSLLLFVIDKNLARIGGWRISESALWFFTVFFGGVGSFIGMHLMHHKTRHRNFLIGVPICALLQLAVFFASLFLL